MQLSLSSTVAPSVPLVDLRRGALTVTLTMTTPACPLSDYIKQGIRHVVGQVKQIDRVDIDVVWEPSWSPEMMDPEVRRTHMGSGAAVPPAAAVRLNRDE